MHQLKEKYNENLKRIDKGFRYLNSDVPLEDKEKHTELFKQLLEDQCLLMIELGLRAGEKEVLEGFALPDQT